MTSIRRKLLGWVIFGFGAAAPAYGIFHTARNEAGELFDYELRTVALSLPPNLHATMTAQQSDAMLGDIADDRIVIEIWDASGNIAYRSQAVQTLGRYPAGLRTIEDNETPWRVFGVQQPARFVQVAQPLSVRNDLALTLALHTLWPLGVMVPAAIVLVLFVVMRGLAPIGGLSRSLASRSLDALEPLTIDTHTPVEVRPLVVAFNDLLRRPDV